MASLTGREVVALHVQQVLVDERQVSGAVDDEHHAGVVELLAEVEQQVVEQQRVLLQVEVDGAVVDLSVGHLHDDLLEQRVLPRLGRVVDHHVDGVVVLVVVRVQEDRLVPVQVLLAGGEQRGDVEARPEQLDVLHQLVLLVLGVQDTELSVHTLVGAVEVDALLQYGDHLLEVAETLVVLDEVQQMVHVHDDVHGRQLGQAELLGRPRRRSTPPSR